MGSKLDYLDPSMVKYVMTEDEIRDAIRALVIRKSPIEGWEILQNIYGEVVDLSQELDVPDEYRESGL